MVEVIDLLMFDVAVKLVTGIRIIGAQDMIYVD